MSRFRVQIMNQFERKSHEYKAIKRYWKLIQQDSRKLSDKRFYRFEHQKRKDEICPFSSLAFLQPTTVDKEPNKMKFSQSQSFISNF
ncbi:IS1181 transposase [Streptococcus pneumoniae]|nr:IS1181 transposase [Streptococcus pneumoniae]